MSTAYAHIHWPDEVHFCGGDEVFEAFNVSIRNAVTDAEALLTKHAFSCDGEPLKGKQTVNIVLNFELPTSPVCRGGCGGGK